jgi:hypothetical protein
MSRGWSWLGGWADKFSLGLRETRDPAVIVFPLSLTYDRRIVNGIPAGRFLDDLAELHSVRAVNFC